VKRFDPPTDPADWTYDSPADIVDPPDPEVGRIRLKDVSSIRDGVTIQNLITHKLTPKF